MSVITDFLKSDSIVFLLRIFIACLCGFIVGVERSKRQKDAGIRTHIIVALGSALMMIISKYGFSDVGENIGMRAVDGSRMAAQIVSGVGFLGAGMIFINHKQSIKGLTTAAGIWTTAGIGMAVGAGMYFLGIASAVLMLLLQLLLHVVFHNIDNAEITEVFVSFEDDIEDVHNFLSVVSSENIDYTNVRISKETDGNLKLTFFARTQNGNYDKLLKLVNENNKVRTFSV